MRPPTPPKTVPCPQCGQPSAWQGNDFRPFCSARCRQIDLGEWADEGYRIPGPPAPTPEGEEDPY